jgi:hypothetical protein
MEVVLSSSFVDDHAVKLSALYCDRIILPYDFIGFAKPHVPLPDDAPIGTVIAGPIKATVRALYATFSDHLKAELKPLFDEGILVLAKGTQLSDRPDVFEDAFDDIIDSLRQDERFNESLAYNTTLLQADPREASLKLHSALLAASAYQTSIKYDRPILTDNMIVDALLLNFMDEKRLAKYGNLAKLKVAFLTQQVLKEFLPDIGNASLEDVLELRNRFRDELGSFRNKMSILSDKIRANPWEPEIKREIDRIVEVEIKPETANLKAALRRSNLKLVSKVFRNLKDARTYLPFVGTVLGHFGPSIAALASVGIAGFEALQDTIVERREIRDTSGVVFLLKGPRKLSKMRRRQDRKI